MLRNVLLLDILRIMLKKCFERHVGTLLGWEILNVATDDKSSITVPVFPLIYNV